MKSMAKEFTTFQMEMCTSVISSKTLWKVKALTAFQKVRFTRVASPMVKNMDLAFKTLRTETFIVEISKKT